MSLGLAPGTERALRPAGRSYQVLIEQLRALGPPRTRQERRAVEELGQLVTQLLTQSQAESSGSLRVLGRNDVLSDRHRKAR